MMSSAAWIELTLAMRTDGCALEIFANGQLLSAVSAQNGAFAEFLFRPNLSRVSGKHGMTLMTRKPVAAAFELNRDDIALVMIMGASRLRIDVHAHDCCVVNLHRTLLNFFPRTKQHQERRDHPAHDHKNESAVERAGALTEFAENFWPDETTDARGAIDETDRCGRGGTR